MTKMSKETSVPAAPRPRPSEKKAGKMRAPKLVTHQFAFTAAEFQILDDVKLACARAAIAVSKGELIRMAIMLLARQTPASLAGAGDMLDEVKRKRAKKR